MMASRLTMCFLAVFLVFMLTAGAQAAVTINTTDSAGTVSSWYMDPAGSYTNHGSAGGTWSSIQVATERAGRRLIAADPMGNGQNDLYVAADNALIRVYADSPTSLAETKIKDGGAFNSTSLGAGDADNNGTTDIVLGCALNSASGAIFNVSWSGSTWDHSVIHAGTGEDIRGVVVQDSNGNGKSEIAEFRYTNGYAIGHEYNGSVYPEMWIKYTGGVPMSDAGGGYDVDRNGSLDVVSVSESGHILLWNFPVSGSYPVNPNNESVIHNNVQANSGVSLGNTDSNGLVDVVVCSTAGNILKYEYDPTNLNANATGYTEVLVDSGQSSLRGVDLADIDNDGLDEIVAVNSEGWVMVYDYSAGSYARVVALYADQTLTDVAVGDVGIVPEPMTLGLLGLGGLGLLLRRRSR